MSRNKRQIQILGLVLALVAVYSTEAFLLVKDASLLEQAVQAGLADSFDNYLSVHLMQYVFHILLPLLFAVSVFFIPVSQWNRIFRGLFSFLLFAAAFMRLVEWQTGSVFYYLSLILYLLLIYLLNKGMRPESEAKP